MNLDRLLPTTYTKMTQKNKNNALNSGGIPPEVKRFKELLKESKQEGRYVKSLPWLHALLYESKRETSSNTITDSIGYSKLENNLIILYKKYLEFNDFKDVRDFYINKDIPNKFVMVWKHWTWMEENEIIINIEEL